MIYSAVRFAVVALAGLMSPILAARAEGPEKKGHHSHIHAALHELREARNELKEAGHDFGGHREAALRAVDTAIKQLEEALRFVDDPHPEKGAGTDHDKYHGYKHHPHIHHAIHELKETRSELKEAKHDFGGHREAAIKDVDYAIEQLELALKFGGKRK
jgi:hypothetical protein